MPKVYDLLDTIRECPGMYLGYAELFNLWLLLSGFRMGLKVAENVESLELKQGPFNSEFHKYVATRLPEVRYGFDKGYYRTILEYTKGDEAKALEVFFTLLDEFRVKETEQPPKPEDSESSDDLKVEKQ